MGTSERRRLLRSDGRKWPKGSRWRTSAALLVASVSVGGLLGACSSSSSGSPTTEAGGGSGTVLLVGTFDGHAGSTDDPGGGRRGPPGDWILVAPGDYHETDDLHRSRASTAPPTATSAGSSSRSPTSTCGGWTATTVIVDGTKAGAPGAAAPIPADQNFGPPARTARRDGRNGIVVWKANDVSIENLTVCNFLGGVGDAGNEIWWNGGADTREDRPARATPGSYLTATSTYFGGEATRRAVRDLLVQRRRARARGTSSTPATSTTPACTSARAARSCDVTIDHAWMEYSALGYSGTNSGGAIVIENSQFDNNKDGVDTNTQIDGDPPAPQNGACPDNGIEPDHPHPLVLGVHPQLRARQQQPQRPPGRERRAAGRPARA